MTPPPQSHDNFDPYNVLLSIATNIPVLLMTASVLQGHSYAIVHQTCSSVLGALLRSLQFSEMPVKSALVTEKQELYVCDCHGFGCCFLRS